MKPDAYMTMYWNEFWMAVEGQPEFIIVAYLRCMSYYYQHNHCKGLRDEDEFLRRLCRIEKGKWLEIRDVIFDNDKFFTQDHDGLWHQKRSAEEWEKAVKKYEAQCERTSAATSARIKKFNKRKRI